MKTFTLVDVEVGKAKEVYGELKKIGVEVYPLFGEHDLIVIADSASLKEATSKILEKMHRIKGITKTTTLVEAEI